MTSIDCYFNAADRMLRTWPATGFVPHCRADDDVPVLTEVFEAGVGVSPIAPDAAEAIARELEQAVLAELAGALAARTGPGSRRGPQG